MVNLQLAYVVKLDICLLIYLFIMQDMKKANIGHRSLADHFGASCLDNAIMTPDRLSEGLVKCISAIYCKLANPSSTHTGFSASSTSSLSSSNTFSPRNLSGSWSPHFTGEATGIVPLQGFKEDTRQRATMIEVSKISLDDDSFNYAAIMLQKFRWLPFTHEHDFDQKIIFFQESTFACPFYPVLQQVEG